jgi:hypothetical protein
MHDFSHENTPILIFDYHSAIGVLRLAGRYLWNEDVAITKIA